MLNVNQAAAVFHLPSLRKKGADLENGWISFDLGIGYNRNADFGNQVIYSGTNPSNSIADYIAQQANANYNDVNSLNGTGSLEEMAYYDYLIDYFNNEFVPETDINSVQSKIEDRKGGQSQLNMALAANYSNKFYIGLNIGLASINYSSEAKFSETGYNVTESSNYTLSYLQAQETKGNGFNAKLGMIYRPIPELRFGATFETPTWYKMDDSYTEVLNTDYTESSVPANTNYPETYNFSYYLRTPMKVGFGLGVFLANSGFISADIDLVDYSKIQFRGIGQADLVTINANNEDVLNNYKSAVNYRLGIEFKLAPIMIRGGYGVQGNPYKNLDDASFKTQTYSGGLGYRIKNYYVDLAYQMVSFNTDLQPYSLNNGEAPTAHVKTSRNNVFATFGIKF